MLLEPLGQGTLDDQVAERQAGAVEPESPGERGNGALAAGAVALVPDHGVPDALQVSADLVLPACDRVHLDERPAREGLQRSVAALGGQGVAASGIREGPADGAFRPGLPVDEGQVGLLDRVVAERSIPGFHVLRDGEHHRSAGAAVEPMHGTPTPWRFAPEPAEQVGGFRARRMDQPA